MKQILDVGQCGFDGPRMKAILQNEFDAVVDPCATGDDAIRLVAQRRYDLILVNRILAADRTSGIDLIKKLVDLNLNAAIMLVSDFVEAQDEAESVSGVRGFGKSQLESNATRERLRQILGPRRETTS